MNRTRRTPLQHSPALVFDRAVDSLGAALSPDTTRHYRGTVRNFLSYLDTDHPEVNAWTNCVVSPTSSAGCRTCACKCRP